MTPTIAIIVGICFYVTIIIGCFAGFLFLVPIILDAETQAERIMAVILASVIMALIILMMM